MLIAIGCLALTACSKDPQLIDTPAAFLRASRNAKPGDEIVIKDGTYLNSGEWLFEGNGTAQAAIRIRPQTPYGAIFVGKTQFLIHSNYAQLSQLYFREATYPGQLLEIVGHQNRVWGNYFIESGNRNSTTGRLLHIGHGASYNRVDHNYFRGSISISISQFISSTEQYGVHNQFDHNILRDIVQVANSSGNGQEGIQIGQYADQYGVAESFALIEENLFDNVVADAEIISIKSSKNLLRNNQFVGRGGDKEMGELTLRGGQFNTVVDNTFAGTFGGIRISGDGNLVANNIVRDTLYGIRLFYGTREDVLYDQPKENNISENTLINIAHPIYLTQQLPEATEPPSNNKIAQNLILPTGASWIEGEAESIEMNQVRENSVWLERGSCVNEVNPRQNRPLLGIDYPNLPTEQGKDTKRLSDAYEQLANRLTWRRLPLNAEFAFLDLFPTADEPIIFDAAYSRGKPLLFAWDFGDGTVSQSKELVTIHRYEKPGTYLVKLMVTDADERTSSVSRAISVGESNDNSPGIPGNANAMRLGYITASASKGKPAPTVTARFSKQLPFRESAGSILVEAEHYHSITMSASRPPWQLVDDLSDSSGNCYLQAPGFLGPSPTWENSSEVNYLVALSTPGSYDLWVRRYAQGLGDNSLYWAINGEVQPVADNLRVGLGEWQWVKIGKVAVGSKATEVVEISLRYRENGYRIDQILLTQGRGPESNVRP